MDEQKESLCELWPEDQIEMKHHSRLYSLVLRGAGSPMIESLTSYISRLAEAHCVHPHVLLRDEILPHIPQAGKPKDNIKNVWRNSPIMNGLTSTTTRIVQVLESLTLQDELSILTMLPWKYVLSNRRLIRRNKAWCPSCYEEWRDAGQVIYDPLLWSLEPVTICSKHTTSLQQNCHYTDCTRSSYPLSPRAQPGFCPWCNRWQGGKPQHKLPHRDDELKWQQWASEQVGELLSTRVTYPFLMHQYRIADSINTCVELIANGNAAEFARQLDVEHAEVQRWQKYGTIPQLDTLLWICARLERSLLQFFKGDLENISVNQMISREQALLFSKSRRKLSRFESEDVKKALEAIIQRMEDPPPSMHEVARRLKYPRETLYERFPEYCRTIGQRYRKYRSEQREKYVQGKCEEVRDAAYNLYAQGYFPKESDVKKMITTPGVFKMPEVQEEWKNILLNLGGKT